MPLHHTIACDSPASRRWRRWAPLVVLVAITLLMLVPGLMYSEQSYPVSLCGDREGLDDCAERLSAGWPEPALLR